MCRLSFNTVMWPPPQPGFPLCQKVPLCFFSVNPSMHPQPQQTWVCIFIPIVLLFPECHINGRIQHVGLWVWPVSRGTIHQRSLVVFITRYFVFIAEYSNAWLHQFVLSSHELVDIWVFSSFWQFRLKLLWTFVYTVLCAHIILISSG